MCMGKPEVRGKDPMSLPRRNTQTQRWWRGNEESKRLLARAKQSVAGGADSTMRVLPYHMPLVVARAAGARIWDVDGNELIDMNMGYGPLIFGHRPPQLVRALTTELERRGTILGFCHELSHRVAELVRKSFPSVHSLRFTSTGTEAGQTAVRLARAFTGRDYIVLFEGHYHGSSDAVFHRYHAPAEVLDTQSSNSVLPGTAGMGESPRNALVLPWNDIDKLARLLDSHGKSIAAVMMEPVMGNAGVIPPKDGYLQGVRDRTREKGVLLIFDEVITGFRVARGGAQEHYGLEADITMFSKALGGGVPLAAVGGRGDIMELVTNGEVFHGGVYSGNPMCLAAALAVQEEYDRSGKTIYDGLVEVTGRLAEGLRRMFAERGIPVTVQYVGPMLSCWFMKSEGLGPPQDYRDVVRSALPDRFIQFQHAAQRAGVYFHPNHFEPWYPSTAHTEAVIDEALDRLSSAAADCD